MPGTLPVGVYVRCIMEGQKTTGLTDVRRAPKAPNCVPMCLFCLLRAPSARWWTATCRTRGCVRCWTWSASCCRA